MPDLTANSRQFSKLRLAGIIVESVLSFEWLRVELAKTVALTTKRTTRRSCIELTVRKTTAAMTTTTTTLAKALDSMFAKQPRLYSKPLA